MFSKRQNSIFSYLFILLIVAVCSVEAREFYYQMGFAIQEGFLDKFEQTNYPSWATARHRMSGMSLTIVHGAELVDSVGTPEQLEFKSWMGPHILIHDSGQINRVWTESKTVDWVVASETARIESLRDLSGAQAIIFAIQSTFSKTFNPDDPDNEPTVNERIELIDSLIIGVETEYAQDYPKSGLDLRWALIDARPVKGWDWRLPYSALIDTLDNRNRDFRGIYIDYPAAVIVRDDLDGDTVKAVADSIVALGKWAGWYLSPGNRDSYQEDMVDAAEMVVESGAANLSRIVVCDFHRKHTDELPDTVMIKDGQFPMMETFNMVYEEFSTRTGRMISKELGRDHPISVEGARRNSFTFLFELVPPWDEP